MENKLWCDLITDKERLEFLKNGRAIATGIVAPAIVKDLVNVYERLLRIEK